MPVGTSLSFGKTICFPCLCHIAGTIIITILDDNIAIIQATILRGRLNLKWNSFVFESLCQLNRNVNFE